MNPRKHLTILILILMVTAFAAAPCFASGFYSTKQPAINVNVYGGFSAAITAVGTDHVTLLVDDTQTITANTTCLTNTYIVIAEPGILTIAAGVTLTVYSPENIIAPQNMQIFTGDGNLAFSVGGECPIGWAGGKPDNATDCYPAFNKLNTALSAVSGIIKFGTGEYVTNTALSPAARVVIQGEGRDNTVIRAGGAITAISVYSAAGTLDNVVIKDLRVTGGSTIGRPTTEAGTKTGARGIYVRDARWCKIHNVVVDNFAGHGIEYSRASGSELGYGHELYSVNVNYCDDWGVTSEDSNNHIFIDARGCEVRWCGSGGGEGAVNGYWKGSWIGGHIGGNEGPGFSLVNTSSNGQYSENFTILGVTLENNGIKPDDNGGDGGSYGQIYVYGTNTLPAQNINVIGCSLSTSNNGTSQPGYLQRYGIKLDGQSTETVDGGIVLGNQVSGGANCYTGFYAISLSSDVTGYSVQGNRVEGLTGVQAALEADTTARANNFIQNNDAANNIRGIISSDLRVAAPGESTPRITVGSAGTLTLHSGALEFVNGIRNDCDFSVAATDSVEGDNTFVVAITLDGAGSSLMGITFDLMGRFATSLSKAIYKRFSTIFSVAGDTVYETGNSEVIAIGDAADVGNITIGNLTASGSGNEYTVVFTNGDGSDDFDGVLNVATWSIWGTPRISSISVSNNQ